MHHPQARFVFTLLALLAATFPALAQDQTASAEASAKVIEVSAKKYEFTPNEIHVKKGAQIQIRVHSVDETHGIKLSLLPQGSKDKSSPGLVFSRPEENGKVEKGKDQLLEFVAQQTGTYEFKCAKLCGFGHGRMKGKLIVDE